MLSASKSPDNLSYSIKQKSNSSPDLGDTPKELEVLADAFRSPGLLGNVLRTLANYAQYPQPPQRAEDIGILLLISQAMVLASRRGKP